MTTHTQQDSLDSLNEDIRYNNYQVAVKQHMKQQSSLYGDEDLMNTLKGNYNATNYGYNYEVGQAFENIVTVSITSALQITQQIQNWLMGYIPQGYYYNNIMTSQESGHIKNATSDFDLGDISYAMQKTQQITVPTIIEEEIEPEMDDMSEISSVDSILVQHSTQSSDVISEEEEIEVDNTYDDVNEDNELAEQIAYYIVDDNMENDGDNDYILSDDEYNVDATKIAEQITNIQLPDNSDILSNAIQYSPKNPQDYVSALNDNLDEIAITGEIEQPNDNDNAITDYVE